MLYTYSSNSRHHALQDRDTGIRDSFGAYTPAEHKRSDGLRAWEMLSEHCAGPKVDAASSQPQRAEAPAHPRAAMGDRQAAVL